MSDQEKKPDDSEMLVMMTKGQMRELVRDGAAEALQLFAKRLKPWIGVPEAAEHFGKSETTIKNWIIELGAPARKVGRDYLIRLELFEAWVEQHKTGALKKTG